MKTLAQSHNYWTRSFNEESSLLSGAVVGGGSGPTAIFYNPASISEITQSKFTLNASLFTFDFFNVKNGLGEGIDIVSSNGKIKPRFISYMIKLKKSPNWSYEIAFMNNENTRLDLTESVDKQMDILTHVPGMERYFALFQTTNHFRDDWIGIGGSTKINQRLFLGMALFVTIKSCTSSQLLNIEAIPLGDSIFINGSYEPFYSASFYQYNYLKYNDYRLLGKVGLLYKGNSFSAGINLSTPSGSVYSDGKRVAHTEKQSNITLPETGQPIPDYVIVDYKEKGEMDVNYKTPFSVSAGFTYYLPDQMRTLYFSAEYFSAIEPYRLIEAEESTDLGFGMFTDKPEFSEWLTYVSGAKPVLNAAIGYSWTLKQDLRLMAGFRTDFNYQKNLDYKELEKYGKSENIRLDLYHLTGGLAWRVFGQDITTGLEYHIGRNKDQRQIANLSDPVEYNGDEKLPLQGVKTNTMNVLLNSIGLYFGASFNFGDGKDK